MRLARSRAEIWLFPTVFGPISKTVISPLFRAISGHFYLSGVTKVSPNGLVTLGAATWPQ